MCGAIAVLLVVPIRRVGVGIMLMYQPTTTDNNDSAAGTNDSAKDTPHTILREEELAAVVRAQVFPSEDDTDIETML